MTEGSIDDRALADALAEEGFRIVSGGTDNHLMLVDVKVKGFNGKQVQETLDRVRITANKNMIPFDQESPFKASGVRLGTPAATARGMNTEAMKEIAACIAQALKAPDDESNLSAVRGRVKVLTEKFPLYSELRKMYQ